MKRYIMFGYDQYYPSGGWTDFIKSSDDIEELKKDIVNGLKKHKCEYYEIVDLNKMQVVYGDQDA